MSASVSQGKLTLSLQLVDARHRGVLTRRRLKRWVSAALPQTGAGATFTVRVVGEAEGLQLNQAYRGKAYATNVLTFDYERVPSVVADIVLCAPVIEAEALAQNKTLAAHYAHMIIHGVLHAQGHDHERLRDARAMERLERRVMQALGLDNPYAP